MNTRRHRADARVVVGVVLLVVASTASAWDRYAGVDLGYSAGDFGTGVDSQLTSLTFTLSAVDTATDISVAVPLLNLTTDGVGTESGPGDITLRAAHRTPVGEATSAYGALSLTLPTGDDDVGLGSGATDVGAAAGLTRDFGANRALISIGYIVTGESSAIERDDVALAGVGAAHRYSRGSVYASFDARTAAFAGADEPREISLGGFHVVSSTLAFTFHTFRGLNDGGPDYGATLGMVQRWD